MSHELLACKTNWLVVSSFRGLYKCEMRDSLLTLRTIMHPQHKGVCVEQVQKVSKWSH